MIPHPAVRSRQPRRLPWSREHLVHERAIALGMAIDLSSWKSYGSALNSYLTFVRIHNFPVEPTEETLSFFVVYMSHHIKPDSVGTYLSGICHQLEPYFPDVRTARRSSIVSRTLKGCKRLKGTPVARKRALSLNDLAIIINDLPAAPSHNALLFTAMITTGFFALLRLGEMTFPDDPEIWEWRKITRRSSVIVTNVQYEFFLPSHKADHYFEGNQVIVRRQQFQHNPLALFLRYLQSRDSLFPLASPLWLTSRGDVPTRSFFMSRLHIFFDRGVGGQSMQAGGTTSLAEHGIPPSIIQPLGRWSSEAFLAYVRKNPVLIQALLFSGHNILNVA